MSREEKLREFGELKETLGVVEQLSDLVQELSAQRLDFLLALLLSVDKVMLLFFVLVLDLG